MIEKQTINGCLDLPSKSNPTLFITRGEDVTLSGRVFATDLTGYTLLPIILTRDARATGFSFSVTLALDQDSEENEGKFTLKLARDISKELKHDDYLLYVSILDLDGKLSVPESLKVIIRMKANDIDMIPV